MTSLDLERKVRQLDSDVQSIYEMLSAISGTQMRHTNRLNELDVRFDGVDGRLDGVDGRLDGIDGRLDGIDDKLGTVVAQLALVLERLGR